MRMLRTLTRLAPVLAAAILLAGCGINTIPTQDEATKTAWAEVQNQYQRRSDLIPNLVATVKGYAAQEKGVLVEVTQARASATQVKVDASTITDPAQLRGVLASVRAEGYAISDRLVTDDALSVAAPIRGQNGTVQAALSLVVTAQDAQVRALVNAVRTAARGISRAIGMPSTVH